VSRARRAPTLAAALVVARALFLPAHAQSVSSGVRGRVVDEAGQAIAGATVRAVDATTGTNRSARTDGEGEYSILLLRPGRYDLSAEAEGYAAGKSAVDLPLNATRVADFTLRMAISERIQVSGETPAFDPSNTTLDTRIDQETIQSLPLNGRQFTDLALLDSSVRQSQPGVFFGERATILTANGSGARANAYLVDGSDNNDFVFGSRGGGAFSAEVIQEFRLVRDGYSAEFGRASGGVMNIVTRSGTNDFTGSAFYTFTNENLNSSNAIVKQYGGDDSQEALQRQQFGFALSGPFVPDKAFYLAAYEGGRGDDALGYTGVDRDGIAGGAYPAATDGDRLFLRTDFNLSPVHYLTARVSYSEDLAEGLNVVGRYTPETGSTLREEDLQIAFSLRSVASPNLFHEARLLWSDGDGTQQANSDRPGVERPQGIYGGLDLNGRSVDEEQIQFLDNVTLVRGDHTLKLGADLAYVSVDVDTAFNPSGTYSYATDVPFEAGDDGLGTKDYSGIGVAGVDDDGDGIVDEERVLETYPELYRLLTGNPSARFRDAVIGLFVQDEWRPGPHWNLNLGLRYDAETFELDDRYAVPSSIPNGGASRDLDNLAPRFSFTWTPTDKKNLIVRGGVGVFYDKVVLAFPAVSAITQQQTVLLGFFQGLGFPCNEDFLERYGVETVVTECILAEQDIETVQLRFSTGDTLDTPYNVQWNLGFERMLGKQHLFGVNYVSARGHHVPLFVDLNPIVGGDPVLVGLPVHADPTVGSIVSIETMGNTWYDGLQLRLQDGVGDWTYVLSYTWSQSYDQAPDPLKGGVSLPPDSTNLDAERARSDNDQRHRFVFAGTWRSPLWKLQFSPVISYASGAPFNVTLGIDDNSRTLGIDVIDTDPVTGEPVRVPLPDGFRQERPAGVGRNTGAATSREAIDAARADQGLPPYTGSLEEPDFLQVDLRVSRLFATGAGTSVEGFVQVFNLFNRANLTMVDGEVNSPTFGQPLTIAGPARIVELGVRWGF
jgi:outer membrane receptor protein involved in Fe transport